MFPYDINTVKSLVDLLFSLDLISSSAQILSPVCRESAGAVCSRSCKLKLLLDYRQCSEKKINGGAEQCPTLKACPATFTDVIFSNNVQLERGRKMEIRHSKKHIYCGEGLQLCAWKPHTEPLSQKQHFNTYYQPQKTSNMQQGSYYLPLNYMQRTISIFSAFKWMFLFASWWSVITYILPKKRICGCCYVYTNSDLQGIYRWQVVGVWTEVAASLIINNVQILKNKTLQCGSAEILQRRRDSVSLGTHYL